MRSRQATPQPRPGQVKITTRAEWQMAEFKLRGSAFTFVKGCALLVN